MELGKMSYNGEYKNREEQRKKKKIEGTRVRKVWD